MAQSFRGSRSQATPALAGEQEARPNNSRPASILRRRGVLTHGRTPEQFVRLEQNLHCGRYVSRFIGLNNGDEPSFVLHRSRNTEIRSQPVIASNARVGRRASAGKKLLADLLVPETKLQAVARGEPVIRPRLRALARPANPTAHQVPVIRIPVYPRGIEIEIARADLASQRVVGVDALDSKI